MQAITTKYLGPTDHRGSRIKATTEAGSKTYDWDAELGVEDNHRKAALRLALHLGWIHGVVRAAHGHEVAAGARFSGLASGSIDGADRYAHCLIPVP